MSSISEAGGAAKLEITLLAGTRELLDLHARELPQRDDLCGAFCGALALGAAGIERPGELLDQDAVALAAGSVVSAVPDPDSLPGAERGRRDYRLAIPSIPGSERSGTPVAGLAQAIAELSDERLHVAPFSGPWSSHTLAALFDAAASLERPVTLIANVATHHLWGSHASLAEMLAHLQDGELAGPAPDWQVGHFACVVGRVGGPRGALYAIADTYPVLGGRGVHVQPGELLARALERRDKPAGGMLAIAFGQDADRLREGALAAGLREELWDNGTPERELAR
jgi:Family of unknown function (DUF6885)